ncbi:phospholipase D-like domain-containing protein [Neobacillus kokaensis]|uniref:PLD phosphodiesterase domain-containing protein n=1 Tax=Neobacillus kokaensis TaxID=2759023 RepID=A0ABQ3N7D5_9BACI|nr:hypothetical protein AM1BK_33080 [Neobacillus kokaensis]
MTKVQLITSELGKHLLEKMEGASTICVLTSFVMKSGVQFIADALKKAAQNGADIKICTGDYLYITQPEALEALLSIDDMIGIRMWKSNGTSFHPKAYMFKNNEQDVLYIGSSNLSKSALNHGVEWNIGISEAKEVFDQALEEFSKLFLADQTVALNPENLKEYKANYEEYHKKHTNLVEKWSEQEELEIMLPSNRKAPDIPDRIKESAAEYGDILPRFAQIEALEELHKTVEEETIRLL